MASLADAPRSRSGRILDNARRAWEQFMPAAVIVGLILAWEIVQRATGWPSQFIVPLPSKVLATLVTDWQFFLRHLAVTVASAFVGFLIGTAFALLLAVASIFWRGFERVIMPIALAIRSVPLVAVTPILIFIFGTGMASKIAVAVLVTFFPTLVNMVVGLRNVDYRMFELFHVMNAGKWDVLWRLRFPASMPQFLAAIKIAIPSAFLGATIAEWINATAGIGYIIIIATYRYRVGQLYAAMIVAAFVTGSAYLLLSWLESLIPWRRKTASPND